MPTRTPATPFQAVTRRRFLIGSWPWRSAGYLLTTLPVSLAALFPLALLGAPWAVAAVMILDGMAGDRRPPLGGVVLLLVMGAVLLAGFGPLVALPLAALERLRLRLVDSRSIATGHRAPQEPGLWEWLRTRYTEPATWRELAYALLLISVLPALVAAGLLLVATALLLIASPLILLDGQGPISLGVAQIDTADQALPYAFAGAALLPACAYPLALLAGVHAALAGALLQGRGREELRAELVEVSRSRARLVNAFEAERRRIERDLHDGAQQRLVTLTMQLGLARLDLPPDSPAATPMTQAHEQAKRLMAELRELIRGIHPRVLTDLGLPAALPGLAERCPIPVEVSTELPGRLPAHIEATAYFAVAEALTNVAKHSEATRASVRARLDGDLLRVEVSDDGHGGADPGRGTGLTGLADRVAVMDGRMVMSSPAGGPTLLRVELPCEPSTPRPE